MSKFEIPEQTGTLLKSIKNDTEETLIEVLSTKRAKLISTWTGIFHQISVTLTMSMAMISLGLMLAFSAPFLPQVRDKRDPLYMNAEAGSWFASISNLASPIGSIVSGIIMDKYGRRVAFAAPLIPSIIAWMSTALSKTLLWLFIARFALGFCGGMVPPVCQVYLAECADCNFRSFTINVGYVSLSIGFLATFSLGAVMHWRSLAWCGIALPISCLLATIPLPETPLWLTRHGKTKEAYKNLLWLRGNAETARNELNEYFARLDQERGPRKNNDSNTWRDYLEFSVLKPIIIIFSFMLLSNATGIYLIVYYALDIISQMNLSMHVSNATVLMSIIRLMVTITFCALFMHVGRRKIYLTAGIGSMLSTLILSFYLSNRNDTGSYGSFIVCMLLLLYVAANTGFMIAPGFLIGELLPARIRGRLAGLMYTFIAVVVFILSKIFPSFNQCIGVSGIMFVFGIASAATTVMIYLMVPETKGKSLSEIEEYFQHSGWTYKNNKQSFDCPN